MNELHFNQNLLSLVMHSDTRLICKFTNSCKYDCTWNNGAVRHVGDKGASLGHRARQNSRRRGCKHKLKHPEAVEIRAYAGACKPRVANDGIARSVRQAEAQ